MHGIAILCRGNRRNRQRLGCLRAIGIMQHGGGPHPDTHAGTAHTSGSADTGTSQHLPALIDAYAHTDPDTHRP